MRITFALPGVSEEPIGGVDVVLDYARWLSLRGHAVTVLAPLFPAPRDRSPLGHLRGAVARRLRSRAPVGTAAMCSRAGTARVRVVPDLRSRFAPPADAVVATSWWTAFYVAGWGARKGEKFQLLQHVEDWDVSKGAIAESLRLPIHKLVISRWLEDVVREVAGQDSSYVPNAIDLSRFGVAAPVADRPVDVTFMTHHLPWKRTDLAVEAVSRLRRDLDVSIQAFGLQPELDLPAWVDYQGPVGREDVPALLGRTKVFLHTSDAEGWPLPPAEAMASGCVLVATANAGVCDYAGGGDVALLSPLGDAQALADNVRRALLDHQLAVETAVAARARISEYSVDRAVDRLLSALGQR